MSWSILAILAWVVPSLMAVVGLAIDREHATLRPCDAGISARNQIATNLSFSHGSRRWIVHPA